MKNLVIALLVLALALHFLWTAETVAVLRETISVQERTLHLIRLRCGSVVESNNGL